MRIVMHVLLWAAIALGALLLIVQASRLPFLRIERITIAGTEATSKHKIFEAATAVLSGKYLYLFPHNNILIFPRRAVTNTLREKFPRLKDAEVHFIRRGEIEIVVVEREPVGIACSPRSLRGESDDVCYFLDATGFMFAPAPVFSGNVLFTYRQDGRRATIGTYFLEPRLFREVYRLREVLTEISLSPVALMANTRDADIFARNFTFVLKEGTGLIFSAEPEEFEIGVQNLQTVLVSPEFAEESGGDVGTIEYIDLRFGNKIFYRLVE